MERYVLENGVLKINEGVEVIEEREFMNYKFPKIVKTVILPDSVKTIRRDAFYYRLDVRKYILSKNLEEIGINSFEFNTSLEKIVLPSKIKMIPPSAFQNNINLRTVIFSPNTELIRNGAFVGCSRLESVTIPFDCKVEKNAFNETVEIIREPKQLTLTLEKEETELEKVQKDKQKLMSLFRK